VLPALFSGYQVWLLYASPVFFRSSIAVILIDWDFAENSHTTKVNYFGITHLPLSRTEMSMSDEMRTPETGNPQQGQQVPQQQFVADASAITTIYTNSCRCSVTPEELVLDFGLNTQMTTTEPVKLTHRIVMNFYTAKRLLGLLANVVQQHENAFGALELDFNRRMRGGRQVMPPAAPSK
jgi:hypothetical protein